MYAAEGIKLPLPVRWIVLLEVHGYVVDLRTGDFEDAAGVRYAPTAAGAELAARLRRDGDQ
jgi:hypothetical protein